MSVVSTGLSRAERSAASEKHTADPFVVSILEAARLTALCRATIYSLLKTGKLRSIKVGTRHLVDYSSIKELMARGSEETIANVNMQRNFARITEMQDLLTFERHCVKIFCARAKRAEAECSVLRGLLEQWQSRYCHMSNIGELQRDTRDALAASPALTERQHDG
jgi:excisionase family DNA binding protein